MEFDAKTVICRNVVNHSFAISVKAPMSQEQHILTVSGVNPRPLVQQCAYEISRASQLSSPHHRAGVVLINAVSGEVLGVDRVFEKVPRTRCHVLKD